jgi:hypothetical protein
MKTKILQNLMMNMVIFSLLSCGICHMNAQSGGRVTTSACAMIINVENIDSTAEAYGYILQIQGYFNRLKSNASFDTLKVCYEYLSAISYDPDNQTYIHLASRFFHDVDKCGLSYKEIKKHEGFDRSIINSDSYKKIMNDINNYYN